MISPPSIPRYNQRIPQMRARASSGLRFGWLTWWLLATLVLPFSLSASPLEDTARQLGHQIATLSGPGAFALHVSNRSSLDDRSVFEVRSALEAQLHLEGVNTGATEPALGTIEVFLSESLREYVWAAEVVIGAEEKRVALVSLPRAPIEAPSVPALPMVLKSTLLFAQERIMIDAALVDMPGDSRLIVLDPEAVAVFRRQGGSQVGQWELVSSLPIAHGRPFPRDVRGRLLLGRDHLFDAYLPGTFCRSSSAAPLGLACHDSDDPWPLTTEDGSVHAFYAASRNFFTGVLSPGIGKVSNVASFYSAAALLRSSDTLWAFAAVDGSLHLLDGMTEQAMPVSELGSDLAAVRSGCGAGSQLLASESRAAGLDSLRAFEVTDRNLVAVSSAIELDGRIIALWPDNRGTAALAMVRRKDTGWYEAYRVSISCGG